MTRGWPSVASHLTSLDFRMIRLNENFLKLKASYLFSEIGRRVQAFQSTEPTRKIIRLGIGDVTEPLPPACISAWREAVEEMGLKSSFRGYGPEQGYPFLREAVAQHDFQSRGAAIEPDEIFISDGAKCDCGNFQELFAQDITVAVPDPVYPVYVDTNVMNGRTGREVEGAFEGLVYLRGDKTNGYVPHPPDRAVDLVYLCFPNNPTGAVATRGQLTEWVEYARRNHSLLLFDAAYAEYIRDEALPRSIFEIEGAREVAVEFRSFSKTAGFTGARCACTVVPKSVKVFDRQGGDHSLHAAWLRRQTTKFNGVSYPVQRAAAAIYTEAGRAQCRTLIDYYMANARLLREALIGWGFACSGGDNAPYLWIQTGGDSWAFFDRVLREAAVVVTPGAGFGRAGEGHVRISAFNSRENVEEAILRLAPVFANQSA